MFCATDAPILILVLVYFSGLRSDVVITLKDITESEKQLLTESEKEELLATGMLTPHVEPR